MNFHIVLALGSCVFALTSVSHAADVTNGSTKGLRVPFSRRAEARDGTYARKALHKKGAAAAEPDSHIAETSNTQAASTSLTDDAIASASLEKALAAASDTWKSTGGEAGGYSLVSILEIAARANPNWGTYAANHAAAHAELMKACEYPNPELEIEAGRERARDRDDKGRRPSAATWSLGFAQPIEMPGKRLARRVEAEAGFAVVAGEALEYNSMLRSDVVEAYFTVQYYAALESLQQSLMDIAAQLQTIARTRVEFGEAGQIEVVNARVELLRSERERNVARRKKMAARAALDALTGGRLGLRFRLADSLVTGQKSFGLSESLRRALSCHPRLIRLSAELEQRYASIDRERTAWWPDLKVGVRKGQDMDNDSVAVTAGIELPLWSRNQGNIAAANAKAQKTYSDIVIAFNEIRRDVEESYYSYQAARDQIYSYDQGLRAAAEEAVTLSYIQYQAGASGYLDVLTARRLLQETQQQYLQALFDAATARARLDRARGELIEYLPPRAPAERNAFSANRQ